ncbi:EAL domain-containing protein [Methylobacter sp.]|uniref:putative bifunctional diguanylate cyclase/phosphodiesterase n=1 Tax=Methylobacter sp. TaxID=2051955 RepID=UPI00121BEE91|nr:EAL domain-containing protein [Methylobacter sp.]TAK61883.1 MAG: EAL domain-containing protein [Methylobacter sp.]
MSINGNDDASRPADSGQPDANSRHKDKQPESLEKKIANRESAVIDHETKVLIREKLVSARESAVDLREENHSAGTKQVAPDDHISMLQQANENLVIATIEAQKKAEQIQMAKDQLDYLAHHDALTDLPNRILLQDRLNQAIELAHRQGRQLAVMFMDLDRFKYINDSLGHGVGDQLLLSVAQRLANCVRHSDTVSRQGGDEFVLLLSSIEHPEDAAVFAQKMLAALALPHRIDQRDLHISVSIGISIYPVDGRDAETLIKSADIAMYYAKESGRNNYKFFEQNMHASAIQRQSIEASLHQALERREFVLYYQPKIDLHNGTVVGVEALIRWQHPELGLLAPEQFIYIAEDCGLILPISRWVQREACLQAMTWQQEGLPPIVIAVNACALEFRDKDFLKNIHAILDDTGLEPQYFELELTESMLMRDSDSTDSVLHALANLGVKLAIDDFGTGYFSLGYLKRLPIDTLKIDQSFVSKMISNPDDAAIVNTIINMSKSLKKRVIAEGVETSEQIAFLAAQHCDEGQGCYFGCPMLAEELTTLLRADVSFPV